MSLYIYAHISERVIPLSITHTHKAHTLLYIRSDALYDAERSYGVGSTLTPYIRSRQVARMLAHTYIHIIRSVDLRTCSTVYTAARSLYNLVYIYSVPFFRVRYLSRRKKVALGVERYVVRV